MSSKAKEFRDYYVAKRGTPNSAASYLSYLRKFDAACGGIDERVALTSPSELLEWCGQQPSSLFGEGKIASDIRSAVKCYVDFLNQGSFAGQSNHNVNAQPDQSALLSLLHEAKRIGVQYYALTGKPLGVTGEVAELEAAEKLGLELCVARMPGFDAIDPAKGLGHRVQIKGRAVSPDNRYRGRCPAIKYGGQFDTVLLVLLDKSTLNALEIWEATELDVARRLLAPGSKSRNNRNSMGISQFKSIANKVWSA